jgi:hypothetical protein
MNSSIIGNIMANGTVEAGSVLNLTNNWIAGAVTYADSGGLVERNTIVTGVGIAVGAHGGPDDVPTVNEKYYRRCDRRYNGWRWDWGACRRHYEQSLH